jgi:NAD(P)-dependent dehydrogenase (short-subunit alcohol dehydrogenase family)
MELKLQGKRALVTGSSSGIGEAIAKTLIREGAIVVVHGRNVERTQRVADDIATAGGKAIVAIGDLATPEGASAVVEQTRQALGSIDKVITQVAPLSVNRIGRADDIAHAVAFLASPLADCIDGANLRVDGGLVTAIN